MAQLPTGTMTFLFTGLDVSTRLWEREPDAMRDAPARHDAILREVVPKLDGHLVRGTGDGIQAVFATADAVVQAAIDGQRALVGEACGVSEPLRVSVGLHTGVAELRDGGHYGSEVNRAARLMPVAPWAASLLDAKRAKPESQSRRGEARCTRSRTCSGAHRVWRSIVRRSRVATFD